NGGPWRQLLCVACRRYFLETLGTIFHGKRVSVELIVRVIACLAEGLGIRGTARVFEVDPNTVLQLSLSRFKLAGPPTPRDIEASNAYAIIHDSLGPVCIRSLIGINSSDLSIGRDTTSTPQSTATSRRVDRRGRGGRRRDRGRLIEINSNGWCDLQSR